MLSLLLANINQGVHQVITNHKANNLNIKTNNIKTITSKLLRKLLVVVKQQHKYRGL